MTPQVFDFVKYQKNNDNRKVYKSKYPFIFIYFLYKEHKMVTEIVEIFLRAFMPTVFVGWSRIILALRLHGVGVSIARQIWAQVITRSRTRHVKFGGQTRWISAELPLSLSLFLFSSPLDNLLSSTLSVQHYKEEKCVWLELGALGTTSAA